MNITLNNGDQLRVKKNPSGMGGYNIQAKETNVKRWYTIGRRMDVNEAIAEMNRRAEEINRTGFVS